jgi:hypothetical protein
MARRCQIRWLVLGALTPFVLLLSSANTASASCGEYVHILPTESSANSDTPTPPPCHGPNCRQAPPAPMPSPVAPAVSAQPQDAVLTSATLAESQGSFRFVSEPVLSTPRTLTSIFHPPRSAAL